MSTLNHKEAIRQIHIIIEPLLCRPCLMNLSRCLIRDLFYIPMNIKCLTLSRFNLSQRKKRKEEGINSRKDDLLIIINIISKLMLCLFFLDLSCLYIVICFLSEDDHRLDLCLQDDVIFDNTLIKVDDHIFAYHYLPLASIFVLDCLF